LSMLKNAGLGVAMGNAVDEVKACADLVIGNNTETGIADVVNQYFETVITQELV
ncbi:HAD hydrolase family protein, partial [Klebsiella pneumoniae]|nr:HAD hydrolase family protein [Klebsiella pneumoniae]